MRRLVLVVTAAFLVSPGDARAQTSPAGTDPAAPGRLEALATPPAGTPEHDGRAPSAVAVAVEGEIEIDGRLEEPTWRSAPAADRFIQYDPVSGEPATQRTEVRFAYDDEHLYIGARMYDDRGADGVVGRLARRDGYPSGDSIEIILDTFLDHLGRTVFWINPAGVRGDSYGPGGSNPDSSWDPIWRAKTTVDAEGWTAEIEIPFSQLRFPRGTEQTWGLQMWRQVDRLNETQMWSYWTRDQQGGPSRFGHLTGIVAPASGVNRLEVLPYVTAQAETRAEIDAADPFAEETSGTMRVGADLKYLVTSDLTLNATVNPDFGQAEVDPAVVNLSAFETFFPEKREFFIEGRGLFAFGGLWCFTCSNISSLDPLFTRRIGRAPQGAGLAFDAGEFADVPDASTILGAAKLTGRTRAGTSVGVLAALTAREEADVIDAVGTRLEQEVEPLTGYAVARVKQDLLDGDLQVGGMLTSVTRSFDDPALEDRLPRHAETLGLDAEWWWGNRTYHWLANAAFSNVSGDEDAILRLQRSSARYFQRPDRDHGSNGLFTDRFDPTLETMRGYGFYSRLAKDAGEFRWEASTSVRSPGFEVNDLGFLTRTDFIWLHGNVRRQWTEPTDTYRYLSFTTGGQRKWNYDGDMVESQIHGSAFVQLPFYWETSLFGMWRPAAVSDQTTRGGPVVGSPSFGYLSLFAATDRRKPVFIETNVDGSRTGEGADNLGVWVGVTLKPSSSVSLSLGPNVNWNESRAQFVTSVEDPTAEAFFGRRYVFADLEQINVSMDTRLNWTFTPAMSLELFLQPLFSANDFSRFKEFAAPRELDKLVYGEDIGAIRTEGEGEARRYLVDPDGPGPAAEFSFGEPDFDFRSLRGNLVYRWEFRPGSTLFLVWTQDRNTTLSTGRFDLGRDLGDLLDRGSDNVFLVKATYWVGI